MKKFLSILLVPAFAILLAVPAFAASSFDESTAQTDNALTGDSPTTANIPIYGYIGQNADISDTDRKIYINAVFSSCNSWTD